MSGTKRVSIVGTAATWKDTPWDDPGMHVWGLNDGYSLGVPRADAWFDLHPIEKMWFRRPEQREINAKDIPDGAYVRPQGHLEWLQEKAKTIDVWLKDTPPAGWPAGAKRFDYERIAAFLKARPDQDAYIASSPVQMLAKAMLDGYEEIHIYGIHLATQREYLLQRPNMEWLMGRAEERGIKIVLPPSCPLLKHSHVYGREQEPPRPDAAAQRKLDEARAKFQQLSSTLVRWPRWKSKAEPLAQLARLKAEMHDAQLQAKHALVHGGG